MLHYFDGSLEIALWKGIPFVKVYPLDDGYKCVDLLSRLELRSGRVASIRCRFADPSYPERIQEPLLRFESGNRISLKVAIGAGAPRAS
jgi:hypothetical protein